MAGKGGAWKVAYADFVTAMMALFMVLWISAQDQEVLIATSRYFQNPFNSPMDNTSGILPFDTNKPTKPQGKDSGGDKDSSSSTKLDLEYLNSVAKDFYRLLNLDPDLAEKPLDIQVTSDGLRITVYDRSRRPLFADNTAEFTEWGRFLMQSLAWMIDRQKFNVVIEGHTRRGLLLPKEDYTPWELSADRANASRRALIHYAVDAAYIERVTGYADTRPIPGEPPEAESNQRVTLSLIPIRRTVGKTAPPASAPPAASTPPAGSGNAKPLSPASSPSPLTETR